MKILCQVCKQEFDCEKTPLIAWGIEMGSIHDVVCPECLDGATL